MPDSIFIVVAAVVHNTRGELLVGLRPRHKAHGGLWEFPGGKVLEGESPAVAIERELAEELEVATEVVGNPLVSIRDPDHHFDIVFLPVRISGTPKPIEHDAVRWVDKRLLGTLDFAPCDASFIRYHLPSSERICE